MITSTKNPKVQYVRELQSRSRARGQEGAFVVEGVRLAEEALAAGWEARLVFYTEDLDERGQAVVRGFMDRGTQVELVDPAVLRSASDTVTPQGILAVLSMLSVPLPETLDFIFIPDAVRDPGNLGTILRTAAAAGVDAVFLPSGVVDPFSPKVLRSAMGAHFRLPVLTIAWDEIRNYLEFHSLRVFLASARAGKVYTQENFRIPLALITGGEAEGAGASASELADETVHIPMPGEAESLNTAIAAGILMFEVVRQRNPTIS